MSTDEMQRRNIFKPARIAHVDEPFHARGGMGMTACGLPADSVLIKHREGSLKVDWDGSPMVTCTDCDQNYTGTWRRGGRDFKAAV